MAVPQIIIVDDSLEDVALLKTALLVAGTFEIREIRDGEAAMQFVTGLAAGETCKDPCLFVLDLQLPKYNGLEILRLIRRLTPLDHVPVVVMTSFASPGQHAEIANAGAVLFEKPLHLEDFERLARRIAAICDGTPSAAAR